ncbi:hypothetical protein NDU88_008642 [Pleurodeles waltl]|uniref:Uncharacterized protein n=1 Tax=Pleurodeles waltl TaxID=8319 RepID=A0AAV7N5J7_PLEWA|nr:hypothetical protein NDU88_008642 [Pleurodeles waltl]
MCAVDHALRTNSVSAEAVPAHRTPPLPAESGIPVRSFALPPAKGAEVGGGEERSPPRAGRAVLDVTRAGGALPSGAPQPGQAASTPGAGRQERPRLRLRPSEPRAPGPARTGSGGPGLDGGRVCRTDLPRTHKIDCWEFTTTGQCKGHGRGVPDAGPCRYQSAQYWVQGLGSGILMLVKCWSRIRGFPPSVRTVAAIPTP